MHKNRAENFAGQKRAKTAKRTRKSQKKAKPGAFWVLEGVAAVGGGCGRILLLEKCTTMAWWWPQQQKDLPAFLTKRCWLELPLKGAPSRRSSLKTCHRHVFLTLGPSRVQVLPRSNEKSQASQKRYLTFLAGAEGLEPSARGFGVDVGKHTRERGRGGVDQFLPQVRKGAVLVWCCEEFLCQRSGQIATDTIRQSSRICWMSTADSSFFSARAAASFSKNSRLAERISLALR